MDSVDGKFEKLLFYKDGFAIFKLNNGQTSFSVKGKIDKTYLKLGRQLKFQGTWSHHARYGPSFQINSPVLNNSPASDGNLRFLCSIPHISDARAKILIDRHGEKVFNLLWKNPDFALDGVAGLTASKLADIKDWLEENKPQLGMELVLHRLGFGEIMREKIKEKFPNNMAKTIRDNPYLLLSVQGIGFYSLDKKVLTGKLLDVASPERTNACVVHVLEQGSLEGHTLLSESAIIKGCKKFGVTNEALIKDAIELNIDSAQIEVLDGQYGSKQMLDNERKIVRSLFDLANCKPKLPKFINVEGLDDDQADAVKRMLENPISFLTGGPGSGKTFTINVALEVLEANGLTSCTLCAPTGKAAKRMSEATGKKAQTIHRMLLNRNVGETVIIDECSMLSTDLAAEVCEFLWKKGAKRVILVGDPDQLPSIGPGRVFDDLLDANIFPVSRLTKVRRQAQGSNIIMNATQIREGAPLLIDNHSDFKTSFISLDRQEDAIIKAFTERIPKVIKKDGTPLDPMLDVQVIAPQHKGQLGCSRLNQILQDALNPNKGREWKANYGDFNFGYKEGDKVIVTKNTKEYDLVNGDIGYIKSLSDKTMSIAFERENGVQEVGVGRDFLASLRPGYAITVHRAQGSEAPMIIVVYNEQTPPMFRQRNMLYTAVTRAREQLWLVGSEQVVNEAIANDAPSQRSTGLITQAKQVFEQLPLTHPLRQLNSPDLDA